MSGNENHTADLTMFHSFVLGSKENSTENLALCFKENSTENLALCSKENLTENLALCANESSPTTPSNASSTSLESKKRPRDEADPKDEYRSKEAKMAHLANDLNDSCSLGAVNDQLVLELSWPLKKRLICNLIDHSELLYGKLVSAEQKKELTAQNQQLIQCLMCLPIQQKIDLNAKIKISKSHENLQDATYQHGSSSANRLVLEIDWELREKVIANLINNHNFAVLYADSISEAVKCKLIKENTKLIQCLQSLPVAVREGEDELEEGEFNETQVDWDASALAGLNNTKNMTQILHRYTSRTENHSSTTSGTSNSLNGGLNTLNGNSLNSGLNSEQSTVDLANLREELNSMQHMFREVVQNEIRPFLENKVSAEDFKAQFKENLGKVCSFSVTGRNCVTQESWHCITCGITGSDGVCKSCMRVCHKDHQVEKKPTVANFCDCSTRTRKCETLVYLYDSLK